MMNRGNRRVCAVCVIALAGCSKSESRPQPASTEPAKTVPAKTEPQVAPPAKPADPDTAFQADAKAFATSKKYALGAWGTAELDDKPGPDRFVEVVPLPADYDGVDDYGGYIVQSGTTLLFARIEFDGRTRPWIAAADEPTWTASTDKEITHNQSHHGGYEEHHLAIRDGDFVVLRSAGLDDVRAGDEEKQTDYADANGVCTKPCPKAADNGFTVQRAATWAELAK